MATTLKAFPGKAALNFHVRPRHDSNKVAMNVSEYDDYLTCIERQGVWFLCHTREMSGWVHGKEIVPITFPAVFIVNDELPHDAQIRLRAK